MQCPSYLIDTSILSLLKIYQADGTKGTSWAWIQKRRYCKNKCFEGFSASFLPWLCSMAAYMLPCTCLQLTIPFYMPCLGLDRTTSSLLSCLTISQYRRNKTRAMAHYEEKSSTCIYGQVLSLHTTIPRIIRRNITTVHQVKPIYPIR